MALLLPRIKELLPICTSKMVSSQVRISRLIENFPVSTGPPDQWYALAGRGRWHATTLEIPLRERGCFFVVEPGVGAW
jgi:hypothetical protein